jgi:charged multivesicular body protein 5
MEDLIDQANEIQESLGRSYGVPDEIDESDLQAGQSLFFTPCSLASSSPAESPLLLYANFPELDALADEGYAVDESEGALPSYLRDSSAAMPDFVDSDPVSEQPTSAQPEAAR